ncbi:MAG: hypothetical protein QOH90_656 [Actinomycetota bacterium]|nr:hypothetical protein [Actinomycetota bacterium]
MKGRRLIVGCLSILLGSATLSSAAPFAHAQVATDEQFYVVGSSKVTTTPPVIDATHPQVGSVVTAESPVPCVMDVYDGPTIWQFDEPYRDLDGDGKYGFGEPYCDANANGRYDGIWVVGGVNRHAEKVRDDIYVRTILVSDGPVADATSKSVAISSLDALGIFDTDVEVARQLVAQQHPQVDDVFVSANHNESAPDTIGLYGPSPPGAGDGLPAGESSGVNDYYMNYLAQRIAASVDEAFNEAQPATLRLVETTAPTIVPRFKQWPTTNQGDDASSVPPGPQTGRIDVWNPKVGILQAKAIADDHTIFTLADYAAHVQNLGHSSEGRLKYHITADWPRYFWDDIEAQQGGDAIYLQGANGSVETPSVPSRGNFPEGSVDRSEAIGKELAEVVNGALTSIPGEALPYAPLQIERDKDIKLPVQTSAFKAAFAANLFPHKTFTTPPTDPVELQPGGEGPYIQSSVGVVRIGDLELIANPGEAFPALTRGSHWGQNESCDTRENPPVPTYYSGARYRWDMGLANDMIGYEIPAWGWDESAAIYTRPDDPCSQQPTAGDKGHDHALEAESLGPAAGNIVAKHLVALLKKVNGDSPNTVVQGRYIFADGTLSRRPYKAPFVQGGVVEPNESAVALIEFTSPAFTVYALPDFDGDFQIDGRGTFIDFDGQDQDAADQQTRGMQVGTRAHFLDVWPDQTSAQGPNPKPSPTPTPSPTASPTSSPTGSPEPSPTEPTPSPSSSSGEPPPGGLSVTLQSDHMRRPYGWPFVLSGTVSSDGVCSGPYTVTIERKRYDADSYKEVATVLSQQSNSWSFQTKAGVNGVYRAIARGGGGCDSEPTEPLKIRIRAGVRAVFPETCTGGGTITGRVRPNLAGTRVALDRLHLDRSSKTKATDYDRLNGRSRFKLHFTGCKGRYFVRWWHQSPSNARGYFRFTYHR